MKQKIILATKNKGKIADFQKLLENFNFEVISVLDIDIEEPEETGETFEANSILKAKYYGEALKMSAIADDSGICTDVINNFPGVYSARIVENNDYKSAFKVIENKLIEAKTSDYSAHFISNITFFDYENDTFNSFEGRINGSLDFEVRGENGFGYCPIFIPEGKAQTFGEMSFEERNSISHRKIAIEKLKNWLESKK